MLVNHNSATSELTSLATATSTMRRSCNFCRSRKIRCSGATICSACSERNVDCVYVREASKGRPKGPGFKASSRSTAQDSIDPVRAEALSASAGSSAFNLQSGSSIASPKVNANRPANSNRTARKLSTASEENNNTVVAELEDMFDENFKDAGLTANNPFQESLAAFHRTFHNDPTSTMDSILGFSVADRQHRTIRYEQLLSTMTQELVEMLSLRFGSLGCYRLDDASARFYAISLANDETPTMFDFKTPENPSPLDNFDSHRTIQMIEVWFSVHPLSNIISKTLFLQSYKGNTHDPSLLALILADASYMHEKEAAGASKETLFRWAAAQLRDRPAHDCNLSTVQVLMLLGWHELCLAQARRATCYLGYAGRMVSRLQTNLLEAPETGRSQINGIDVAEVEAELVRNIYWLTFSITLWSFMQIDRPYPQLLPTLLPTEFPPVDESSSAVVRLEVISDNVSTLAKQSRMIQELWPLSHVASTTAHIYALLPREQDADEISQSVSWQSRPLHQLRRLLRLNQNMSSLCKDVRKVLANAVEVLEVKVENASSKALVLAAYHTTMIHLLFPRLNSPEDRVLVSEELLTDFCTSGKSLLKLFSVIDADQDSSHLIARMRSSTFADVFVLGLDVCGRAIEYFHSRSREGSPLERENIASKTPDVVSIASQMHRISKTETLLTAKNLRLVKKNLKRVKSLFNSASVPHEPTSSSLTNDETAKFFGSGSSTLSPTPTTSAALSNGTQSIPEMDLDAQAQSSSPYKFDALPAELWTSSATYDMLSGIDFPTLNSFGHEADGTNHDDGGNVNVSAILNLHGSVNNDSRGPPEGTTVPIPQNVLAGSLQGQEDMVPRDTARTAMDFGRNISGLYDVDMDRGFSDVSPLGVGDSWPLEGRPPTGGEPS